MSSDIDISDSSGNPLYLFRTQPEYSVTRFIHDWTTYEWNNGKVNYNTFTTEASDRPTFLAWYSGEANAQSPYNNGFPVVNGHYRTTVLKEDWTPFEWNNGRTNFSDFSVQPGDRIEYMKWYTNQAGGVSPYLPVTIQCLSQDVDNTIQMANPFTFNNVAYLDNSYLGLNIGQYTITGVTTAHPIGFVIKLFVAVIMRSSSPFFLC